MSEEIVFNSRDIRALERAMDSLRDRQLHGAMTMQEYMARTPKEITDRVWKGDKLENFVKEWDHQMTYWGHFTALSRMLEKCAMIAEGGKYELVLRRVGSEKEVLQ